MEALKKYLRSLKEDHDSGEAVAETSGYGALQNLLNAAGEGLKPRVRAIVNPKNRGAGIPDGGLFTAEQFERREGALRGPRAGQLPARGAVEVKGPKEDVREVAKSEQVRERYLPRYGQVLVTNYREFLLVERGSFGEPVEVESYALAGDADRLGVLRAYLDPDRSDDEVRALAPRLMRSSGEFKAERTRRRLTWKKVPYEPAKIVRYPFKPFDVRLAYLDPDLQPLFSRPAPDLLEQRLPGNGFLVARESGTTDPTSPPFFFSSLVCDYHSLVVEAKHVPVLLRSEGEVGADLFSDLAPANGSVRANLSAAARRYLARLGAPDPDGDPQAARAPWLHALAIGYSGSYRRENAGGLREDWPRVPMPDAPELLSSSALLETERRMPGVTAGKVRPELRGIAAVSRTDGGQLDPGGGDLALEAGWGYLSRGDVVMPGRGKAIKRGYTDDERVAIEEGASALGLPAEEAFARLGEATFDVYLNGRAYWGNVPESVWGYTIGGYQVLKKWLSYREGGVLGRSLTVGEVRELTATARRIAALVLLEPKLDENYAAVKASAFPWPDVVEDGYR